MEVKKTKKVNECVIAIAALGILLLGLIGYITLEKTIWKKECGECETAKSEIIQDESGDKMEDIVDDNSGITSSEDLPLNAIAALANSDEYKSKREGCFGVSYGRSQNSSIAPYQIMKGSLGVGLSLKADVFGDGIGCTDDGVGSMGFHLYRVDSEAEWQFGWAGQEAPPCSKFETDDMKKAFADFGCYSVDGTFISISSLL